MGSGDEVRGPEAQQLPFPTGSGGKRLSQRLCQSLDEAEAKETPRLQLRPCQSGAIAILKNRRGDGLS